MLLLGAVLILLGYLGLLVCFLVCVVLFLVSLLAGLDVAIPMSVFTRSIAAILNLLKSGDDLTALIVRPSGLEAAEYALENDQSNGENKGNDQPVEQGHLNSSH